MSQLISALQQFIVDNNLTDAEVLELHGQIDWHHSDAESVEEFIEELRIAHKRNFLRQNPPPTFNYHIDQLEK